MADHFVAAEWSFFARLGGQTMLDNRIKLAKHDERRAFTIVYDELWSDYLAHIGGQGALLYCFLRYLAGREIPNPCSKEWHIEVCQPLGLSVVESHQAWARLQEMGLITPIDDGYVLREPMPKPEQQKGASEVLLVQIEELFGRPLSMTEITQIEELASVHNLKLVMAAAKLAVDAQALSLPYIRQVLLNWKAKGIKSAEEAAADVEDFRMKKARRHARKGETSRQPAEVSSGTVTYDESEVIMRRIRKSAGEEVVNRGW